LRAVDQIGQLATVEGADWDLEIGTVSALNYRRRSPLALLFDDIAGYPRGYRVLTGSVSSAQRLGYTLGLGTAQDDRSLVENLRGLPTRWQNTAAQHRATQTDVAPILDNCVEAPDVDLSIFPTPRWHEHDGGRYLGTGCMVITSDPHSGAVNGGAYRIQLQDDGRTATINIGPGKHGHQNIEKWFASEGRAPFVASMGHDPIFLVVAGTEVPAGVSELDYAGAVLGRPVEFVRAGETGLPIPATSEIAVEGWLTPDTTRTEGPFGEWTGYYSGSDAPVLAMNISRLYFRDEPIILGAPPGLPPHDYSYMRSVMKSAMILDGLTSSGLTGVTGVWAHECGGGRLLIAVALKQAYGGHSRQAAYLTAQGPFSAYMNRYVIVVDDDIDPRNLDEVMWAVCTRSDPANDIEIMTKSWGDSVDPVLSSSNLPYNSRAVIDACRDFHLLTKFPKVAHPNESLIQAARRRWPDLLAEGR
jgi:4-hydroxy-3-polyprenylbenzoate decarboxylase